MSRADRYLNACKKEAVDCTPVWIMRQAGRYLEEYRAVRTKHSFIEVCKTPELAVELTLQPVRRFEIDAAIIFADILLPLEKMGIDFEFTKDDGPRINNTVRTRADVEKIRAINPMEEMAYLMDAIRMAKRELNGKVPLIGFSGAPFTLASYITEGGGSRNYLYTKTLMYQEPATWHLLMEKLTDMVIVYLNDQIKAGVQAVQVFDSWVGCLSQADYREFVLPHQKRLMASLDQSAPHVHFAFNASHLLKLIQEAGGDVIGLDWRIEIDAAWKELNYENGVQGNLDPVALYGSRSYIKRRVAEILAKAGNRNGHIFNLGHGILPTAPIDNVKYMIDIVHELSARK
ncbi:MAG: uroporphyrinogen decarboxylase [Syntrophales bacterium]|jgi:uroporphyrinogen decarboxylase|nr:uroporphyrinogen decarboxylase [Syntrophales bacterium]